MPGDLHDDVRLEEQNGEDSFLEHEDANAVDDEKVDGSTAGTPMMPRGVSMNITEAEPGREYTMWPGEGDGQVLRTPALTCSVPDENGQLAPTSGALLPAGYQLDATIPGRPWVCPVRTCRKALCKRTDLGFHFQVCQPDPVWCYFNLPIFHQRVHFAACLNDNGDGTFSIKGIYKSKSVGKGGKILVKAPPIVVSKEPLESNSPIPKPELPVYLAARPLGAVTGPKIEAIEEPVPDNNETADLWSYIQPRLFSTTSIPNSTALRHLLALPRRRDVQFNAHRRRSEFVEGGTRDIAAMVIQVTGDQALIPCTRCRKGKGPFQGCVVAPEHAHPKAKARYPCCANCLFGGKKLHCSLIQRMRRHHLRTESIPAVDNQSPTPREETHRPKRSITQSSLLSAPPRQPTSSALISQGTFQGQNELLEMEDWEIAPGRIRESAAQNPASKSHPVSA
jgi:hypothetical protein